MHTRHEEKTLGDSLLKDGRNLEMFFRTKHSLDCSFAPPPTTSAFQYYYFPIIIVFQPQNLIRTSEELFWFLMLSAPSAMYFLNYSLFNLQRKRKLSLTSDLPQHEAEAFQVLNEFLKIPQNLPVGRQNNSAFYIWLITSLVFFFKTHDWWRSLHTQRNSQEKKELQMKFDCRKALQY